MNECALKEWYKNHPDEPCWGELGLITFDDPDLAITACEGHINFMSHIDDSYVKETKKKELDLLLLSLQGLKEGLKRIEQSERTPTYVMEFRRMLQTIETCINLRRKENV